MALNEYKILGQVTSGTYQILPISSVALTSNIATITTGTAHGIVAGDLFDISATNQSILNIRGVAASAPTTTTFTFPRTTGNIGATAQTAAYLYKYSNASGAVVTNKVKAGGMATLTTSAAHGLAVGDWVTVWINDTNFDGDYVVYDAPTTTTFRYVAVGNDVATTAVTSGTAAVASQKATTVYTVPANRSTICSTLNCANNLTHAGYFSVYIVKSGDSLTSPADKTILHHRVAVISGETFSITMGHTLAAGDSIVVRASHAGMHFNLFGTELS